MKTENKEFNHKRFLAPTSIRSSAMIHAKVKPDGIAKIRISDCNKTIVLWNDITDPHERVEMMTKIANMQVVLRELMEHLGNVAFADLDKIIGKEV